MTGDFKSRRMRLSAENLGVVSGDALRGYAMRYVDIERDLEEQIASKGIALAPRRACFEAAASAGCHPAVCDFARSMPEGVLLRNDCRSFAYGWISPACEACRTGEASTTFYLNTECNRDCFFCFNPNQRDYEKSRGGCHDLMRALDERKARGIELRDIALTGGEPLLYPELARDFFSHAHDLYPEAYTRLYTNGDFASDGVLAELGEAGLDEVRFSVKQDRPEAGYEDDPVIGRIRAAKSIIPHVMVEMPVLPGDEANMRGLLAKLADAGCDGVNLLELCYPFHNWGEYERRGYEIKNPPYRVPYNYEYAGGLPVAGSEDTCLSLLEWAASEALSTGVHYCSLENKFTSQVFLANSPYRHALPLHSFSSRDFFFKSCRAFGEDAQAVVGALARSGCNPELYSQARDGVEFHPSLAPIVAEEAPGAELVLGYHIAEETPNGLALRELALDYVLAADFDPAADL